MNKGFSSEIQRLVILLLLCLCFGLVNGKPVITTAAGVLGYLVWTLWSLRRLGNWLQENVRQQPPPEGSGFWGEISDCIMQLQKQARRERELMQAVIKRGQETTAAIRDGIILLDRGGDIEWFNSAAQQLLGLRNEDLGNSLFNYIRHPTFRNYFNANNFKEPLDLPAPQNDAMRLQYQLTRFGQGEYLVVVRDISRMFKLEQMRKDFVANLSHELKTPLTVIRGYVETINMSNDVPEKWRGALQQVEQQSLRMTALIQDLTELSKLETSENLSTHRPVDLRTLLERVLSDGRALSAERQHNLTLKCADEIVMLGNEKELQSAFSNLVFNAVKYSPPGTSIRIHARCHPLGLLVTVKDKGHGIDSIHLPRLTERFYRVDSSRNAGTGGTGLGLAIVKHVMLRHGGHLNIKSKLGKGSTFTCIFPPQKIISATPVRAPKIAATGP